jgi:hypothetical protein
MAIFSQYIWGPERSDERTKESLLGDAMNLGDRVHAEARREMQKEKELLEQIEFSRK